MPRKIEEWIGKSDDTSPPPRCRLRLIQKWEGKCAKCGVKLGPANPADFDHILPLADGGRNAESNLQPVCRPCHREKTKQEAGERAKVRSLQKKHFGIKKKSTMPGSRDSKWKKKLSGEVVRR